MSNCRCEPKLVGLAELSEHPAVIISAYLVVIFPWGIMQNVDFISEKWRSVRHTRHLGYVHLALSIIPLPYIMFYAHLQQISSDYKEMMAAVVVILMAIYHICRTIWGLLQLDRYHAWCTDLMEGMLAMKMVRAYGWQCKLEFIETGLWNKAKRKLGELFRRNNFLGDDVIPCFDPESNTLVDEPDEVIYRLDRVLKVNNEMVDNELGGTDLAVSVDWKKIGLSRPSKWLKTGEEALCATRWSAAFLCEFGQYWACPRYNYDDFDPRKFFEELFTSCPQSLEALKLVTYPVDGTRTNIEGYFTDNPGKRGVYGGETSEYEVQKRRLVIENIASAYPTGDGEHRYVFTDIAVAIMSFKKMDRSSLGSLKDYTSTFSMVHKSGWELLLWQLAELPADKDSNLRNPWNIPAFPWGYLLVPLWDVCTNWRVLQATVNIDNDSWMYNPEGHFPSPLTPPCYFEHTRRIISENPGIALEFSGCVMEMVRTFLADWIHTQPSDASIPNWAPMLPTESLEFTSKRNHDSHLWEWQSLLQETIAKMERAGVDLPASPYLIMLFILAFPCTEKNLLSQAESLSHSVQSAGTGSTSEIEEMCTESEDVDEYRIHSPFTPQDIKVHVKESSYNGETKTTMTLVIGNSEEKFMWADWNDAAMGYMKGKDDVEAEIPRDRPEHVRNWRKRTPSKCDLGRPILVIPKDHPELPDIPGDIPVWTGWLLFDIKLVQFEMNQWLEAAGFMHGFGEIVRPEVEEWGNKFDEEVELAEVGLLLKIMEWNRA